jgi:histidinol-phosphate aminotransferase
MRPLVNDVYLNLEPYVPGKPIQETQREYGLTDVVKLASNENPLGASPMALQAVLEAAGHLQEYPDGGCVLLREALADFLKVSSDQVLVGNGSNELIEMVLRTCVRAGENVVSAWPSFVAYRLCAQAAGAALKEVPLRDGRYDMLAMAQAVDACTKVVFIGNPNNPTGTYVTRQEMDVFFASIPADVVVVLDEAYAEYATAQDYPDGLDYVRARPRTLVLRTFSKCYGLAALRVGYGVGDAELIGFLNRGRQPFNVNALAQAGALAALQDQAHVQRCKDLNTQEMARVVPLLLGCGCEVLPSQGNFVLVNTHKPAQEVFVGMLKQGVIVRPMAGYGYPCSVRITLGTPEQNNRCVQALKQVLNQAGV